MTNEEMRNYLIQRFIQLGRSEERHQLNKIEYKENHKIKKAKEEQEWENEYNSRKLEIINLYAKFEGISFSTACHELHGLAYQVERNYENNSITL